MCFNALNAFPPNLNDSQFHNQTFLHSIEYKPQITISHKDMIVNFKAGNEAEIFYENSARNANIENSKDIFLTLHFDSAYPIFLIINENFYFNSFSANWVDPFTAECMVPEGIYKIYTLFLLETFRFVVNYDVDLSTGTAHDIWIENSDATIPVQLKGYDIHSNLFSTAEKYYATYFFHILNEDFFITWSYNKDEIYTTELMEEFNFFAGELKFNEESIYITQHGPVSEIDTNLVLTNDPSDYIYQDIVMHLPNCKEELLISIGSTLWTPYEGSHFYQTYSANADMMNWNGEEWRTNLYMMNHVYHESNMTTCLLLGYMDYNVFTIMFLGAPFHCLDDAIGSFYNIDPITVDYLSPDGGTLEFDQPPIYQLLYHLSSGNVLNVSIEQRGYNSGIRLYDVYSSTFRVEDMSGSIIAQGDLTELSNIILEDESYILTIEDPNETLAGLQGTSTLVNYFDFSLQHSNPPLMTSFMIFNADNEPVNRLDYQENASVMFAVADVEFINNTNTYFPVINDSVKVFCKRHEEDIWQEYETVLVDEFPHFGWTYGKVFWADISPTTAIDSVAYDMKIHFTDNDFNYTELILEPAFTVGDFEYYPVSQENLQNSNHTTQLTNYPNPFYSNTTISFNRIPTSQFISVEIYSLKGQKVRTLVASQSYTYKTSIVWDGCDASGKQVASGEYIVKLKIDGEEKAVRKIMMLK